MKNITALLGYAIKLKINTFNFITNTKYNKNNLNLWQNILKEYHKIKFECKRKATNLKEQTKVYNKI